MAVEVALEQAAVLCIVGDQAEEQDHLSATASDRVAENSEDVHREKTASAALSRYYENQESTKAVDTNGGDRESVEESREIDAGHEETR